MQEHLSSGFPTRSDTYRPVHPQKMAGSLKFQIYKEEGSYYPSSIKNKGADQLCSYCLFSHRPKSGSKLLHGCLLWNNC